MIYLPGVLLSLFVGLIPAVIGFMNKQVKTGLTGFVTCFISGSILSLLIPVLINLFYADKNIFVINSLVFGLVGSVAFAEHFSRKILNKK